MQDMQNALIRLVAYGRNTDLLPEEDEIYTVNRLLELFEIDELQGELSVHEQIEVKAKMCYNIIRLVLFYKFQMR